jgi:hypothetical protein
LKKEALDCTMWRARLGRGFGPVVRQTTKWINKYRCISYPCRGLTKLYIIFWKKEFYRYRPIQCVTFLYNFSQCDFCGFGLLEMIFPPVSSPVKQMLLWLLKLFHSEQSVLAVMQYLIVTSVT